MSPVIAALLLLSGLVLLALGGEVLVRGAIRLSRALHISPAIVGLTIVAAATSLPELAVSLMAAFRGSPDVALGNVVGSNIFNLAAILGISALLFPPLRVSSPVIRFDVVVMAISAVLLMVFAQNGSFGPIEGGVLVTLLVLFLTYRGIGARKQSREATAAIGDAASASTATVVKSLALIVGGAGVLTGGAELLVRGAIEIAEIFGVSQRVIALTIISAGTGLPELATAITAGIRKQSDVAIGNVIGSNIFNVFGIMGTVALVKTIPVNARIAGDDMWWMLGFSALAIYAILKPGRRLNRIEGAIAVTAYALYIIRLL